MHYAGGNKVSDTHFQILFSIWNTLICLVVVIVAPGIVAADIATLVTAGAVPVGVLKVDVGVLINGPRSNDEEALDNNVHRILA